MHYGGLQQVKKSTHRLEQHDVVRGLGNRQVKTHIRLRGQIRVVAFFEFHGGIKAGDEFLFVGGRGTLSGVPGGAGFYRMAGFQNVVAIVRIVLNQRFERLNNALLGPGLNFVTYKSPAAATANQNAFADQFLNRLAKRRA
ncbi:hypothetical protein D3C75_982790 [compost metagenome]